MEHELDGLEIAAEEAVCNEPCKCSHADGLQAYYDSIVDAMLKSAKRCIPKGKGSSGKKLGWNDELKDLKRVAQSDYVRWRNAGKPRGNDLYKTMCSSRCHFKRGLAESRRHDRDLLYSKLATDLNTNSQSDFWSKVKHGLYPVHSNTTLRVGECTTDVSILDLWKCHFSDIINSEPLENVERERLLLAEALQSKMRTERPPWWCVEVHFREVEKAIKYLKLQKSKGPDCLQSEHLRYGGSCLSIHLSVAFTAFLRHSFIPYQFLESHIVPIVKDKRGDMSSEENYRGIAISSVMSKVLERIILDRFQGVLGSRDQQFGFKRGHSCSDCSFVLKGSVDYYLSNGNQAMYSAALDLSKAYDSVIL